MASETTNLKLVKPTANEPVDVSVINGNMDKIDTAVKGVQDSISDYVIVRRVDVTIPTGEVSASVTAPTVSGYSFLCWVEAVSNGWPGLAYTASATSSSTKIWMASTRLNDSMVLAYAMYVKSS